MTSSPLTQKNLPFLPGTLESLTRGPSFGPLVSTTLNPLHQQFFLSFFSVRTCWTSDSFTALPSTVSGPDEFGGRAYGISRSWPCEEEKEVDFNLVRTSWRLTPIISPSLSSFLLPFDTKSSLPRCQKSKSTPLQVPSPSSTLFLRLRTQMQLRSILRSRRFSSFTPFSVLPRSGKVSFFFSPAETRRDFLGTCGREEATKG